MMAERHTAALPSGKYAHGDFLLARAVSQTVIDLTYARARSIAGSASLFARNSIQCAFHAYTSVYWISEA
jgi:hypothetical protein